MTDIDRTIAILKKLLSMGRYSAMINRIDTLALPLKTDVRLLRLYGVALGMTANHLKARIVFMEAFETTKDDIDLSNALTSYFALGDFGPALRMIEAGFAIFSGDTKEIIACAAVEAIRIGSLKFESLPGCLRTYLDNVAILN